MYLQNANIRFIIIEENIGINAKIVDAVLWVQWIYLNIQDEE